MKTHITENTFLNYIFFNKPLKLCLGNLKSFLSRRLYLLLDYWPTVTLTVHQRVEIGLAAFREHALNNVRNLVGNTLLVVGFIAVFLHQIFSHLPTPTELDRTWYYLHDYYFLISIRFPVMFILLSAGFLLLSPAKWKYAYVPFSLAQSLGWMLLLQRVYFLNITGLDISDKATWQALNTQYNNLPSWEIIVVAICLGVSIILSLDSLIFRYTHTIRGNHTRLVGVAEMDLPIEKKEPHLKVLAKEFRNLNSKY